MEMFNYKNRGITIIETLIYMVIVTIVFSVIAQSLVFIVRTHQSIKLRQSLESSGTISMERILREIRNASSIDLINSVFGSSSGKLALDGTDQNGNAYTMVFDTSGGTLNLSKNGGAPGALSAPKISVDSLIFSHLATSTSDGIRVEISLSGTSGADSKILDLFGFAVLRDSS